MTTSVAWGIVGTGSIARTFAGGVRASDTGRLVAVGSRTQERADAFAGEFGIERAHGSYDALLADPAVEAVYISTPHPHHAEWAIRAADAGKHVLCEKPLTLNYPEAMAVVEAARRNDVFLMEAFMYRCHPQTAKLVELIRGKVVGEVRVIHATFSFQSTYDARARLFDPELGGGAILDVGCYCMSMARLIAGGAADAPFAEPVQVRGVARLDEQTGVDLYALAALEFPDGVLAQLSTGVLVNQKNIIRVDCSEGSITVPDPWVPAREGGPTTILVHRRGAEEPEKVVVESEKPLYALEADTVAASIEQGKQPPAMTWDDSLGNMRALDTWRQSVRLEYPREAGGRDPPGPRPSPRTARGQPDDVRPDSRPRQGCLAPGHGRGQPADDAHARRDARRLLRAGRERVRHGVHLWWGHGGAAAWPVGPKPRHPRPGRHPGQGRAYPYCTPEDLSRQLLESLERLQMDHVDIYMMHRDNPEYPVSSFIDVLNAHKEAGRMTVFGASNWSIARVEDANRYAAERGLAGFAAMSNNFSLARMIDPVWAGCISASDPESRAWLARTQMPLMPWSSQARGFFTGRARPDDHSDPELVRCWYSPDNFERLERVNRMARERGVLPINIALAYVLAQPFPTFPLIGPRALSETRTSVPALEIELTPDELRWLNLEA